MALQKVDLNLFTLFNTLMRHRSATAAGRELGVTASAVSHGLARLRRLLDDELFIARPDGMHPTPRAIELAPSINDGLGKLIVALESREFNPAGSHRSFAIACSDYADTILLPHLLGRVVERAPHVHVKVFPANRLDVVQQLDENRVQLVVGWFDTLPNRIRRRHLVTERAVFVVRAGHPLTEGAISDERVLGFPHAVVELTGSESQGDDGFIDDRGVRRRVWIEYLILSSGGVQGPVGHVAVTVPHYAAIPSLLRNTDLVATMPERLARQMEGREQLVMLKHAGEMPTVSVEIIWHERASADPGVVWLLGLIDEALATAATDEGVAA